MKPGTTELTDYYFSGFWVLSPLATATSNSDGKFTMNIKGKGKAALIGQGERQTGFSTEKYYWIVWFSLDKGSPQTLMLSNDNLLSPYETQSQLEYAFYPKGS